MAESCIVCNSPHRSIVGAMAECGATSDEIAETVGLDAKAIAEHSELCMSLPRLFSPADEMADSDARLRLWRDRADELYLSSGLQGDQRGQVAALREGVRAELEFRRRLEAREAKGSETEKGNLLPIEKRVLTVEILDQIIRKATEKEVYDGTN
jgi:hypothetical protein